jgi:hypothetical protein
MLSRTFSTRSPRRPRSSSVDTKDEVDDPLEIAAAALKLTT